MSVLIRGMEMPKDCLKCPFCLFADGYWKCLVDGSHADFGGTCRPQSCPLVHVPPHGRLIDADAEAARVKNLYNKAVAKDPEMGCVSVYEGEIAALKLAPTIIPAEEGE